MATVAQLVEQIAKHTGISQARCRLAARNLQENGYLPISSGRAVEHISAMDIAVLLLAVLANTENFNAARAAQRLFDLSNSESKTAGHQLHDLITEMGVLGNGVQAALDGELVVSFEAPLVIFRLNLSGDPVESHHLGEGVDAQAWRSDTVRHVTVLPMSSVARIVAGTRRAAA